MVISSWLTLARFCKSSACSTTAFLKVKFRFYLTVALPLQVNIKICKECCTYIEAWDTFAPASFKGAQPICYYCREAGHVKKDCPELKKVNCFQCGASGHTQRRCRGAVKPDALSTTTPTFEEELDAYTQVRQNSTDLVSSPTPVDTSIADLPTDSQIAREIFIDSKDDLPDEDIMIVEPTEARNTQQLTDNILDGALGSLGSKYAPTEVRLSMDIDDRPSRRSSGVKTRAATEAHMKDVSPSTTPTTLALVFTKHCAIICLNQNYYLDNDIVSLDERCISANVIDKTNNTIICNIINIYGPAQRADRLPFIEHFMSLPYIDIVSDSFPTFLMGDLNLQLAKLEESCSDDRFLIWYDWLSTNFSNCFPAGRPTFQRQDFRSTIDYVFSNVVGLPQVTACQQHYLPAIWTDHQLLCFDLMSIRDDVGPSFWRFNSSLLHNASFLTLLDEVVSLYASEWVHNTTSTKPHQAWEAFKRALRDTCETVSTGSRKHRQSKIAKLQHQY
ncbi:unnamed protein product [Mucor hiemalis]